MDQEQDQDLFELVVDNTVNNLRRPRVLMHPRVQQVTRRAGRYTTAQIAAALGMDRTAFSRLYQRRASLRCLGIPLDAEENELPAHRAAEAKAYLWDLALVEWWFRIGRYESED